MHLAAGLAADVVAAPLWTPTDVIMQRLQIQGPGVVRYRGAAHAARPAAALHMSRRRMASAVR